MIIRIEKKTKDYFTASNEPFNDDKLSFGARGILAYLLSKPDDWEVRNEDLYNQSPAGRAAVDRMLKELKDNGYMRRYRENNDYGFLHWITVVYEDRRQNPEWDDKNHCVKSEKSRSPNVENRTFGEPKAENPTVGLSDCGKPDDILSTERNKLLLSSNEDSSGKPPEPVEQKNKSSPLEPETSAEVKLFEKINATRVLIPRNKIKRFKTLEQKQKCNKHAARLQPNEFEAAITRGLEKGIIDLAGLLDWVAKWQMNGAHKNGRINQKTNSRSRTTSPEPAEGSWVARRQHGPEAT